VAPKLDIVARDPIEGQCLPGIVKETLSAVQTSLPAMKQIFVLNAGTDRVLYST
jgi:hypothetical protein